MTERLYFADPYLKSFDAQIVSIQPRGKQFAVVLDRSAFYPTGGGQLHDLGTLNEAQVLDVQEVDGQVVHVVDRNLSGTHVHGEINWARRWDLTQQHTGQHILSQAFYQLFEAETISVHMSESNCTLDLPKHLSSDQHMQAEELANEIAQSNRAVHAKFVGDDEWARMPLRKPPAAKHEQVRVVEIADFDWSPCGGTHVRSTGEVGLVKVIRAERRGSEQRIEFSCGMRALRDYRWKNQVLLAMAAQFSVTGIDLPTTIQQLVEEHKETRRQLNDLRAQLLDHEAEQLWNQARNAHGVRWVQQVFNARPTDEVRQLAIRLRDKPSTVILFAVAAEKPNLIFARSAGLPIDMGKILRELCASFGGRGGGQPELAQGGVMGGSDLVKVLDTASEKIRSLE